MDMNFTLDLTEIVVVLILMLFSVITGYVIPLIKSRTSERTYKMLEMGCSAAVYFAQQWYKQEDGEVKKEKAIEYAENWLKERKIRIDMHLVADTIEAELKKIKTENENFSN